MAAASPGCVFRGQPKDGRPLPREKRDARQDLFGGKVGQREMLRAIEESVPGTKNIPIYLSRFGVQLWDSPLEAR